MNAKHIRTRKNSDCPMVKYFKCGSDDEKNHEKKDESLNGIQSASKWKNEWKRKKVRNTKCLCISHCHSCNNRRTTKKMRWQKNDEKSRNKKKSWQTNKCTSINFSCEHSIMCDRQKKKLTRKKKRQQTKTVDILFIWCYYCVLCTW